MVPRGAVIALWLVAGGPIGCQGTAPAPPPPGLGTAAAKSTASQVRPAEAVPEVALSATSGTVLASESRSESGRSEARRNATGSEPSEPAPVLEQSPDDAVASDVPPTGFDVTGQVVRGDPTVARSVATVDIERCFEVIPSYRKMISEKSSKEYARYLLLLSQANEEFRSAVDWIALRQGYDLVVECGGVRGVRTVDITESVCDHLLESQGRSSAVRLSR